MRSRVLWVLSRTLLLVLLGAALATLWVTGRFWWQQQANLAPPSGTTLEALKEKLEAYDKRADELEKLLALLLGVSTIYAIALGFSAYQQLKDSAEKLEDLRENAQAKIDQLPAEITNIKKAASEEIQEFAAKVQSKFPLFADMDVAIRDIMDRLTHLLPVIDWSDEDYRNLTPELKQEILFYEKTVAALEYFDLRRVRHIRQTASEIYHGLGNFYGLKYASEDKQSEEDKDRSRFYLDRAIRHDPENSGALNDRGFLAANLDRPPDYQKAREVFIRSLELDPEQQRARYNLAYVEHAEKNYARSEQLLSEALDKKRWQTKLPARHRDSILYNRACARTRLGELSSSRKRDYLDKAIVDLEAVFPVGPVYSPELVTSFKNDIQPGEDLALLTLDEPWKTRIATLVARLP